MSKRFPTDLASRGILKLTDKLLVHNIDTGVTEYTTVSELLAALNLVNNIITKNGCKVGIGTSSPKSKLDVVGLPIYANNAAAIAGGLQAGSFYRTNADPDPVCVVH